MRRGRVKMGGRGRPSGKGEEGRAKGEERTPRILKKCCLQNIIGFPYDFLYKTYTLRLWASS